VIVREALAAFERLWTLPIQVAFSILVLQVFTRRSLVWLWLAIGGHALVDLEGRSDSTLNRQGVRIGTAELYRVIEDFPEIADSLVVGVELPGGGYAMPLFVVLAPGQVLDSALTQRLSQALREQLSPRHVPDVIRAVPAIPRTLTGKKLEAPVKRILGGEPVDAVASRDSLLDPSALDIFATFAV
jgi:acetoacetyl-CoA synthetase